MAMLNTATYAAALAAAMLIATPQADAAGVSASNVTLAASSGAKKPGAHLNHGAPKGLGRGPSFEETVRRGNATKKPYPDQYDADTSRGNYGCHWMGKRAIETDNSNWWARYRACKEAGGE